MEFMESLRVWLHFFDGGLEIQSGTLRNARVPTFELSLVHMIHMISYVYWDGLRVVKIAHHLTVILSLALGLWQGKRNLLAKYTSFHVQNWIKTYQNT